MTTTPSWVAPAIRMDGVQIRVTTRAGGVSQSPWDTQNLGDHVGDIAEHVTENRYRLQERTGSIASTGSDRCMARIQ